MPQTLVTYPHTYAEQPNAVPLEVIQSGNYNKVLQSIRALRSEVDMFAQLPMLYQNGFAKPVFGWSAGGFVTRLPVSTVATYVANTWPIQLPINPDHDTIEMYFSIKRFNSSSVEMDHIDIILIDPVAAYANTLLYKIVPKGTTPGTNEGEWAASDANSAGIFFSRTLPTLASNSSSLSGNLIAINLYCKNKAVIAGGQITMSSYPATSAWGIENIIGWTRKA